MKPRATLVLSLVAVLFTTAQTPRAQSSTVHIPCPGDSLVNHAHILEHAALAELAYEAKQTETRQINILHHCPDSSLQHDSRGIRDVEIRQLPSNLTFDAKSRLKRRYENERLGTVEIREIQHNGVTYHICDRDMSPGTHIAVAFRWMLLGDKYGLGYTVGFVAGGLLADQEEVQAISLFDDRVLGVPGTDEIRSDMWVSSLNKLVAHSCVFEFSAEVTHSVLDCFTSEADCSIDKTERNYSGRLSTARPARAI